VEKLSSRLLIGFALYGVLALLAAFTLDDWRLRTLVLIVLGALAFKSWIGEKMRN
jgi:uncharacterized membrane-anchored protein